MTAPDNLRNHGDEVMVFDAKRTYEYRGRIVGVHRAATPFYDILPRGKVSLRDAMLGIPESRLRSVAAPYLAYERKPDPTPKHVLDDA
jgi:transposase InsO family protein